MVKFKINIKYGNASQELNYINSCLSFLKNNVQSELARISQEYEKEKHKEITKYEKDDGMTEEIYQDLVDDHFYQENYHFESVSRTIIESIFIRQIAIVEKFLVDLSFIIYKDKKENELLPPNCNITKKEGVFSDCIKSVEAIDKYIDLNIKNMSGWKIFFKMRKIRHELAHGNSIFILKNQDAKDEYNRFFENPIVDFFENISVFYGDKKYENFLNIHRKKPSNNKADSSIYHGVNKTIIHPEESYYKLSSKYDVFIETNDCLYKFIANVKRDVIEQIKKA